MFDTKRVFNNQTHNFNSISGTLIKSSDNSTFILFHTKSYTAQYVFSEKPRIDRDDRERIVVLQTMLCGDGQMLVEYELVKENK